VEGEKKKEAKSFFLSSPTTPTTPHDGLLRKGEKPRETQTRKRLKRKGTNGERTKCKI
jgi:hypothetical protein